MYLQLDRTQTNKTCSKQPGVECVMEGNSCATGLSPEISTLSLSLVRVFHSHIRT